MERCLTHRKEPVGPCNWCGTKLCEDCINQRNGHLVYCEKCGTNLRVRSKAQAVAQPIPVPTQSFKKPTLTRDGYLDLT